MASCERNALLSKPRKYSRKKEAEFFDAGMMFHYIAPRARLSFHPTFDALALGPA
jgi:hypothetical protein